MPRTSIEPASSIGPQGDAAVQGLAAGTAIAVRRGPEGPLELRWPAAGPLTGAAIEVQGELDRVSHALTGRIRRLAERYATPSSKLAREVEALAARVDAQPARMGFRP